MSTRKKLTDDGRLDVRGFRVGQVVGALSARYVVERTVPPRRYSQADLLRAMVHADEFALNDRDRAVLRERGGIGTARTRGALLDEQLKPGGLYLTTERVAGQFYVAPTPFARKLVAHLVGPLAILRDVGLTARWQAVLAMVERGDVTVEMVRERQATFVRKLFGEFVAAIRSGAMQVTSPSEVAPPKSLSRR